MTKNTVSVSLIVTLKVNEYALSGTLDDPPLSYPSELTFHCFV